MLFVTILITILVLPTKSSGGSVVPPVSFYFENFLRNHFSNAVLLRHMISKFLVKVMPRFSTMDWLSPILQRKAVPISYYFDGSLATTSVTLFFRGTESLFGQSMLHSLTVYWLPAISFYFIISCATTSEKLFFRGADRDFVKVSLVLFPLLPLITLNFKVSIGNYYSDVIYP